MEGRLLSSGGGVTVGGMTLIPWGGLVDSWGKNSIFGGRPLSFYGKTLELEGMLSSSGWSAPKLEGRSLSSGQSTPDLDGSLPYSRRGLLITGDASILRGEASILWWRARRARRCFCCYHCDTCKHPGGTQERERESMIGGDSRKREGK